MQVKRLSAAKYLKMIVDTGLLKKIKISRTNYYVNVKLIDLFVNHRGVVDSDSESIESVHENAD